MTVRRSHRGVRAVRPWGAALLLAHLWAGGATAQGEPDREVRRLEREVEVLLARPMEARPARGPNWVEGRLADAELYYRLHDYIRAGIVLMELVQEFGEHPAAPNARALLADALFEAGDVLGAREHYRYVLVHRREPAYAPYVERALGRMVEIAIRTQRFDDLEAEWLRGSADPSSEAASATAYFRGKLLFGRAVSPDVAETGRASSGRIDPTGLEQARLAFAAVEPATSYGPQARYFVGVVHILRGELPLALRAFSEVPRDDPRTPEHRRVADLARLAVGRVRHALGQPDEALAAYGEVAQTSAEFPRALFESAWVHIERDDTEAATRALEVLAVAAPESPLVPDAQVVRGNLLLRAGRLGEADVAFDEATATSRPILDELDAISARHRDLPGYFAEIVRAQREVFSVDVLLPPLARRYSEADPTFERAATTLEELTTTRTLVRETAELVERLELALSSRSIVNVYSDARDQSRTVEMLRNRIARLSGRLVDELERGRALDETQRAQRDRRRALEAQLADAPVTDDDATGRDEARVSRIRALSRTLRELEVEIVGLEARITASERYLSTATMRDPAGRTAVLAELQNHRQNLGRFRAEVADIRRVLELARMDVGVGDDAYRRDAAVRTAYEAAVAAELAALGPASASTRATLARLEAARGALTQRERVILDAVSERTVRIRAVVAEERQNLDQYRDTLALLDGEAVVVVGGVSTETFRKVRRRFYDLALRAEVGHVDVAWMDRERHRQRLEELSQARAVELEELDGEYADILDRTSGGGSP